MKKIKILLTNDDGIYADGIYSLHKELKKIGSVVVVAPDSQRSSVGHGITLSNPVWVKKMRKLNRISGYGITGTPADCIKFALTVLMKKKPDIIVSGINLGPNDGCSVFYSGTVAAAREGTLCGIPSVAISLNTFVNPDFSYAAKIAARIVKKVILEKIPKGTFLNVNVPNLNPKQIKGTKITKQGKIPIKTRFSKRKNFDKSSRYWMTGDIPKIEKDSDIDTVAVNKGYVSVTPIQSDLTDYSMLSELKNWNL